MDFDEYEYLEKTVENAEVKKEKHRANGSDRSVKSEERGHGRSIKHKSGEKDDDDVEFHSRHSKSGDDSRHYERKRERGSSRHGLQYRDGVKEKDQHRSSGGSKDRKRDRDRDHENKDGKRGREREIDRERDQERDRRDRGSESEQEHRSRSRSERHRSDPEDRDRETILDKDREISRDKDFRDRERVRETRERVRESRRHKEKKEEATQPDPDPERDQRTVFAYQISLKADERDVYEFFSRAGKVRDVRLIMDRNSRRSKGVGYIEFYDAMSVPMAIALSGQPVLGQPVMVKPSEAEKNLVQSTTSVAGGSTGLIGPYSGGARRLYVGNLHISMSEADIRKVFEAFGQVELVQLPLDESGHCKGFGFVQFARLEDARNAQSLNGQLEIGGRTIKVSAVTDQSGMLEAGGNTGDFDDDDEGGGLSLNACSRAILMQKLDRSGTASSMVGSLGNSIVNNTGLNLPATGNILAAVPAGSPLSSIPAVSGLSGGGLQIPTATIPTIDTIGVPSECLMLKNMFDPKDETEPDFDLDIKEDVEAECSKFGTLKHIYVDKKSAGFVYLRFEDTQSAISAQRSLHGRWFAGKMITASFMVPQSYEDKFPDSR
ncbi:RNA-binding protein 39 isoform X1 [Vigna umbellata]|uniref:RNA-binding protein 39 isoform X1 n=1 Tax=Vigna umbellata TaxID=87088 RepID=UPI001F5F4EDB|nr:RNA-binding protein 39 isoform X1 [Vigna umbellata]XP_047180568.1 RNA-binding protein 39 isoform X1 [Vigna umbellata]XP_047180569.1 RNA-binding protein 39 isoform X1 [Vigna umbellata]